MAEAVSRPTIVPPLLDSWWTDEKRLGQVVYVGQGYVNLEDAYTEKILRVPTLDFDDVLWREVIPIGRFSRE